MLLLERSKMVCIVDETRSLACISMKPLSPALYVCAFCGKSLAGFIETAEAVHSPVPAIIKGGATGSPLTTTGLGAAIAVDQANPVVKAQSAKRRTTPASHAHRPLVKRRRIALYWSCMNWG